MDARFGLPARWLLPLLALPLLASIPYTFVCDDAFITFRFVRNLIDGHGLVWNTSERVEGYTNFLWAIELAALWGLFGWRPEWTSAALSLLLTLGVGLGVARLAARSGLRPTGWVVAAALLLWGTNRSVWVWTTSGLETRQFTLLVLLGVLGATRAPGDARGPVLSSTAFGLAALTRPEAMLFGPLTMGWWAWRAWRTGTLSIAGVVRMGLPFAALVGSHLLWRRSFYGEWLPNTYYAKNVRDWWDAGGMFLAYASLEHALYLVIPLALAGTALRWRRGDPTPIAFWIWAVPYVVHVAKIGGDHFEFRMFDVLWPFLYVLAADGLVALAQRAARPGRALALATGVTVAYGAAIPLAHDLGAFSEHRFTYRMKVQLDPARTPFLYIPPLPWIVPAHQALGDWLADHSIAARHRVHQLFAEYMLRQYGAYRAFEDEEMFSDAVVTSKSSIGVFGFYLDDIDVIDERGLTDHTIARFPVPVDNDRRKMAHDRRPPPGYLRERGVNLDIDGVHASLEAALHDGAFAAELAPGVYAAFNATPPDIARIAYGDRPVHTRVAMRAPWDRKSPAPQPVRPSFEADGTRWRVARWLGRFDDDTLDVDWTTEGDAFERQPALGTWRDQRTVRGVEGRGLLNSWHPSWEDTATGVARSPAFLAEPDQAVALLLGGGASGVGVRLVGDDGTVLSHRTPAARDRLQRVVIPLAPWAGRSVSVEVFDDATGPWGHVLVDAVALVRAEPAE